MADQADGIGQVLGPEEVRAPAPQLDLDQVRLVETVVIPSISTVSWAAPQLLERDEMHGRRPRRDRTPSSDRPIERRAVGISATSIVAFSTLDRQTDGTIDLESDRPGAGPSRPMIAADRGQLIDERLRHRERRRAGVDQGVAHLDPMNLVRLERALARPCRDPPGSRSSLRP